MRTPSDLPSDVQSPTKKRFGLPYTIKYEPEIIGYETSLASDTRVAETSDDDERWSETDSPGGEVSNVQENIYPAIAPTVNRYLKQKRSALGKVAYVVYAGKDVGVFYNWTAASVAISGLEDSSKIYKGYSSYEDAHSAWNEFMGTGHLPSDVAATLGSKPYPTPPTSAPPDILSPPTTPQRGHTSRHHSASPLPSQTPFTPRGGHAVPTRMPSRSPANAGNRLNTIRPIASASAPSTPTSMQSRSAVALAIVHEEALRADQEDFWVVFTGIAPGVHRGREAGERAFGPFENPSFVRTSTREYANQIFVDGYMKLLVVRYVN